jgi:D-amino-acid oxidase
VYVTVAINPVKYLPWLKEQLVAKNVKFIRKKIQRLDEVRIFVGADGILVNATALGK